LYYLHERNKFRETHTSQRPNKENKPENVIRQNKKDLISKKMSPSKKRP
jgi:hypothetical protein